jgi:CRP-like cAMP-binding protein
VEEVCSVRKAPVQPTNQFNPKKVLFKVGQRADIAYIIQTGEVLCLKFFNGRLIPVYLAKQGDTIGEQAMISGSNYTYYAIAMTHVEAHSISTSNFTQEFMNAPSWARGLLSTMINRFDHTANLIAENRIESTDILNTSINLVEMEIEFKKLLGL